MAFNWWDDYTDLLGALRNRSSDWRSQSTAADARTAMRAAADAEGLADAEKGFDALIDALLDEFAQNEEPAVEQLRLVALNEPTLYYFVSWRLDGNTVYSVSPLAAPQDWLDTVPPNPNLSPDTDSGFFRDPDGNFFLDAFSQTQVWRDENVPTLYSDGTNLYAAGGALRFKEAGFPPYYDEHGTWYLADGVTAVETDPENPNLTRVVGGDGQRYAPDGTRRHLDPGGTGLYYDDEEHWYEQDGITPQTTAPNSVQTEGSAAPREAVDDTTAAAKGTEFLTALDIDIEPVLADLAALFDPQTTV